MNVDRTSEVIFNALEIGQVYAKFGDIKAEEATVETPIETVLADGTKETKNVAKPGDFIVTNPGGERYVVLAAKFPTLYAPKDGEPGVYEPTGQVVATQNPYKTDISMMAVWGTMQSGAADCWVADTYNPKTGERENEPRIIGNTEFAQTYKLA